jgi:8-oxo-dGTP pyrophosphatase MutT (NUDIX family)
MIKRAARKKILPNVWMAPGGKREEYEGVFECARRETKEETGLEIKNLKILCSGVALLKDLGQEIFFHFVSADYGSGKAKASQEDGELKWLTLDKILNLDNLLAELKPVLPVVFGSQPRFISYKAIYEKGNKMVEFEIEKGD